MHPHSQEPFNNLVEILDTLLGPNGCPWDRKQTLSSLRKHLLEEACEVIDAIDENSSENLQEEIGDLFLNSLFLAKLAEKEGHFDWQSPLRTICDKLIRRHPHIFGNGEKLTTPEEVLQQWNQIKEEEKKNQKTTKKIQQPQLPKSLTGLARAQRLLEKLSKKEPKITLTAEQEPAEFLPAFSTEAELGKILFNLLQQASEKGLQAEWALTRYCKELENRSEHH